MGISPELDEDYLEQLMGKWGLALAGKAKGLDAGRLLQAEIAEETDPKSISHEHTFDEDTANADLLDSTLARFRRWWAKPARARSACANDSDQIEILRLLDLHACSHAGSRDTTRYRPHRALSPAVSGGTGLVRAIRLVGVQTHRR